MEEGARASFPKVVVQRCIVHLVRNSVRYIPTKEYKRFTAHLKKIYGAPSLTAAEVHVAQLFNYGSAVRKVMYTTNAIESVNSSFREVTKRAPFPIRTRC